MFYIDGMKIRDEYGRERIFRGINICLKFEEMGITEFHKAEKELKKGIKNALEYGANIVRLGFNWAMLEPEENVYDEKILKMLKDFVQELKDNNIYVLLDMHQDLFFKNVNVGDGAPKWLTEDYKKLKPVAIWAEGYFYMRDVQRAFNDFWQNKNGMQDRFVKLWQMVTDEFSEYDNVIAYDYFNEPQINDNSNKAFCSLVDNALMQGLGVKFNAEKYFKNGQERRGFVRMALAIVRKVKSPKRLKAFLNTMDSYDLFGKAVSDIEKYVAPFSEKYYQPFFDNISSKCDDGRHLHFFEHCYYSNLGVPFEIKIKENYIYSPHAYDIFIDSPLYNNYSSNERIKFIFDGIRKNQIKMNVPVVMGEWGGGAVGNEWVSHIDYIYSLIEENHWSSIYWGFRENHKFLKTIIRPYPVAVCGDIGSIKSDSEKRTFELTYTCNDTSHNTEIFIPERGIVAFKNKIGKNVIFLEY